ncbi:RagB/SusD family nutrient uptake outer membrane protein [Echinicola salinicaeni]|uniref:RagB/SusD family nutrient uptake outer membrane protein n=1 Tax=Echinicola salinicaeni TaxID=2762757 RepID=UPI001647DE76|nr:RagB/SusD family nutrient uptake outer membrane protein [Echinicola salinicaeni]
MKRTINILLSSLIALGGFSSCEGILEESPKTILSPNEFFQNPDGYESVVVGIYSGLPLYVTQTHEMLIDIYGMPSPESEQALPVYNNQPTPFFYNAGNAWNRPYSVIKDANFIISNLEESPLDDVKKNQLLAESRFLRAYAYFDLVQLFGDVPLPKVVGDTYESLKLPRSSQEEVYDFILEDLLFAENNLPDEAPQEGRVYKLVAKALLARVYATMAGNPLNETAQYNNALEKALEVINSQKFSLEDDYSDVFHHAEYTSESIWEKQYVPGRGGNSLHNSSCTLEGYRPILVPGEDFINSFPEGDRRKQWGIVNDKISPISGTVLPPYFQKFVDNDLVDRGTGPSGAIVSYAIPLIRLAEMYLIAAEAENALNGPTNAYQYINQIRQRARVDKGNATHVPDLEGLSKEQFQQAVIAEYNWELHQEGHGWHNMKRFNTFDRIQEVRGNSLTVPIGAYNQTWPIPIEEITNNNIEQNPLYQ